MMDLYRFIVYFIYLKIYAPLFTTKGEANVGFQILDIANLMLDDNVERLWLLC